MDRPGYLGGTNYWFGSFSRRQKRANKRELRQKQQALIEQQQQERKRLQEQQRAAQRAQQAAQQAQQAQQRKAALPKPVTPSPQTSPRAQQKAAPQSAASMHAEIAKLSAELDTTAAELPEMDMPMDTGGSSGGGGVVNTSVSDEEIEEMEMARGEQALTLAEKLAAEYSEKRVPKQSLPQQSILVEKSGADVPMPGGPQVKRPGFIGAILDALFGPQQL